MLTSRLLYSLVPVMNIKAPTLAFWSFSLPPPAPTMLAPRLSQSLLPPCSYLFSVGFSHSCFIPSFFPHVFFSAPKASVILLYPFVPEREPWLLWTSQMPLIIIIFFFHIYNTPFFQLHPRSGPVWWFHCAPLICP